MSARWVCRWVLVASVATLAACGGAASRLQSHIQRGQSYFANGDYKRASIEFRNAMQIAPKDVGARLLQARTAEKLGQPRDAVGLYLSILDLDPDNLEAQAALGRLFIFGGVPDRALKTIEPGLKKHPDTPELLIVRATARARLNDTPGAIADAERALKLAPDDEEAISLRAGLYERGGDPRQAEQLVTEALKRLPQSVALREVLFNIYLGNKDDASAEGQMRALIKLRPKELSYREQLALLLMRNHRLDDAQQVLEDAIHTAPESVPAKLQLVSFIAAQRGGEPAEARLRAFIAAQPDEYDLRFALGDLQQQVGDVPGALATYREIANRDGKAAKGLLARDRIAALQLGQGKEAEASAQVEEVLRLDPRDADALLVRGELALRHQDPVAAIADLRAVVLDQPNSAALQKLLARAYLANGESALAEQALHTALDLAADDFQARVQLADLLMKSQRAPQAVALLEEAVRRTPGEPGPREALINAYLDTHDYKAAERAAADLITLRPNEAPGFYLAGIAARAQNQPESAQKNLERAHELAPLAFEPLTALTQLYMSRNDSARAIALVQQAVADGKGKDAASVNLLGELYLATKQNDKASAAFTQATQITPKWWVPYRNLALIPLAKGDLAGAIAACERARQISPEQPQLVTELAQLYEKSGRPEAAMAVYESVLKRQPKSEFAANNLAMLLVTYRSDKTSLDRARDLTSGFASSGSGSLLDTAGWVRFKRGEYTDALPVLERASALSPNAWEIRYHLAMAQLRAGQTAQARANLESALVGAGGASWSQDARVALAGLKDRTG